MAINWTSILLVVCAATVQVNAQFRKIPMESYQEPQGMSLELPCVTDQTAVMCIWLKNGNVVPGQKGRFRYNQNTETGDCSLHIHNLTYPEDNHTWECQIPTLTSMPKWPKTNVVVLVKPNPPKMAIESPLGLSDVIAEKTTNFTCVSEGGNPFARIEWYLNGENITGNSTTMHENERGVVSKLNYIFQKRNNGNSLSCLTVHPLITQNTSQVLNVHYKPIVAVSQKVFTVVDGANLEVDCAVDANPPANTLWKPNKEIPSDKYNIVKGRLIIRSIDHEMDGIEFQCSASNSVGSSQPETVQLNVLYGPRLVEVNPKKNFQQIMVGGDLRLECRFIGNPKPEIHWHFVDSISSRDQTPQSDNGVLLLKNVSYVHEGDYYCDGRNFNSTTNQDNSIRNQRITVNVIGRPHFLMEQETVFGYNGLNTRLQQVFCSDPFPKRIYWQVDEQQFDVDLTAPNGKDEFIEEFTDEEHIKAGRLIALDMKSRVAGDKTPPTCFTAALIVTNTDDMDKRDYKIVVENKFGTAEGIVTLEIYSVFSGAILITIVLVILLIFLVFTALAVLFLRRKTFQPVDGEMGAEKLEIGEKNPVPE